MSYVPTHTLPHLCPFFRAVIDPWLELQVEEVPDKRVFRVFRPLSWPFLVPPCLCPACLLPRVPSACLKATHSLDN